MAKEEPEDTRPTTGKPGTSPAADLAFALLARTLIALVCVAPFWGCYAAAATSDGLQQLVAPMRDFFLGLSILVSGLGVLWVLWGLTNLPEPTDLL